MDEPDLQSMSEQQLIGILSFLGPRSEGRIQQVKLELQRRAAAKAAETATKLVTATENLVTATRRLMWATWVLAALTVVMTAGQLLSAWAACRSIIWPK